ncbi:MAG: ABC-type transport system, permease component [Verrucomicrobiales bacterium]|nr:ABC-type transport system, permease component [Verrucomicrobiales bacterium]
MPGPRPIPSKAQPRVMILEPMDRTPGLAATMEALLKRPGSAVREFAEGLRAGKLSASLTTVILGGLALFGLTAVGFSSGGQWWATPLKMISGLALSTALCLPSFYIFSCLSGLEISFRASVGLLMTALGLTGLLLAGFTPVVWVFSQSTGSLVFLGGILLAGWLVALFFGMKLLTSGARALGMKDGLHLRIWLGIFVLVTLQMTCALRPLLGKADTFLPNEKKFFLQHWGEQIGG